MCRKESIILSFLKIIVSEAKFDLKTEILIKKSIGHRLSREEVIEMLVSIGHDKGKAKYLVNLYYKKRNKEKQMKL